jgi:lactoylglutathione lyase
MYIFVRCSKLFDMKKIFARILLSFAFTMIVSHTTKAQANDHPSLNHVAVYVNDLQKSGDFYKSIVGLEMIPEPFHDGRHIWFKIAAHSQLHLISGAKTVEEHDINAHLCFSVSSMEKFIDNLTKNKVPFYSWQREEGKITKRVDGVQQIYFKDPDGYWIEINNDTY